MIRPAAARVRCGAPEPVGCKMPPVSRLELRIPPLVLVAATVAGIWLSTIYAPLVRVPFAGRQCVAAALVLAGLLLAAGGVLQFRRHRTTVNPMSPDKASAVVTSGSYRISRNPMYLGMAVVLLGVAAWGATLTGYLLVGAFCAYLTRFQIVPEERALLAAFGQEFSQYQARVRRWI